MSTETNSNSSSSDPLLFEGFPVFFPKNQLLGWLKTPKREFISENAVRPGLFSTQVLWLYGIGVFLIFLFESYATFLTSKEGFHDIIKISVLVILDFFVAMSFYLGTVAKINLLRNHDLITKEPKIKYEIRNQLRKLSLVRKIGHALLFAFASIKIYFALRIFNGSFESSFWIIFALYMLGALLHSLCTGQFFSGIFHDYSMSRAEKLCKDSWGSINGIIEPLRRPIEILNEAKLELKEKGKHKIIKEGDNYVFQSYGFLSDSELSDLIAYQNTPEMKEIVAKEGVKFQLQMIDKLPKSLK